MNYLAKIFNDVDGNPSSKRWVLFVFVVMFVVLTLLAYFKRVDANASAILQSALDKDVDIIKWMGGFVVAERAQAFVKR